MPVKLLLKYKIHSLISQGTLITQGRRWKYKVHSDLGSIRQHFLANMLQPCGSRVKGQFGLCRPVGHWFLYWDRWHRCRLAPAAMQIPVPEARDGDQELRRIGHWQPSVVGLHRETLDLIQPPAGKTPFPFTKPLLFSTHWKPLKQVLHPLLTLLSFACCQEVKHAVTLTLSGREQEREKNMSEVFRVQSKPTAAVAREVRLWQPCVPVLPQPYILSIKVWRFSFW